jgi:hypothetical protein
VTDTIEVGPPRRDNRRVLKLAGIAAAVILAVVVLPGLLFGGGGGTPTDEAFPPVDPSATTTTVVGAPPAETFQPFTSKNPFRPLIDTTPIVSDEEGGVIVTSPTEGTDPTFGLPDGGVTFPEDDLDGDGFPDEGFEDDEGDGSTDPDAGPGDDGSTTTTAAPPPARQPDRVSLLEVFTDQSGRVVASVRVNDVTHQVGEGEDFATSYRVLDLDIGTRCGQFLFGDDRFRLCEDEETLK